MLLSTSVTRDQSKAAFAQIVLAHDERHLRRKVLTLSQGDRVLVDLAQATALSDRDRLVLEDGRYVEVVAAEEALLDVRADDPRQLSVLAWHIGNRHLPAQIEADRILIGRDHVIADMLAGLGADVREVMAPFTPERGAYSGHAHAASHSHSHSHSDAHGHAHGPAGHHDHAQGHTQTHTHTHSDDEHVGEAGAAGQAIKDHA